MTQQWEVGDDKLTYVRSGFPTTRLRELLAGHTLQDTHCRIHIAGYTLQNTCYLIEGQIK